MGLALDRWTGPPAAEWAGPGPLRRGRGGRARPRSSRAGPARFAGLLAAADPAGSAAGRGAPLDSAAPVALAVAWSTSSSSDMRAVSAATRPETPSRMSVSRLIVSACRVDSRFRRRSAPSWMAVARAVASSSAFLACAFELASALSDFFLRVGGGALRLVPRRGERLLRLVAGAGDRLLRLGASGGDRPLGLFLGRGEHALGLLTCLGPDLLRLGLRVVALPGYLLVGLRLLGPGLVIGQLEDLGDALADFLVRGLGAERLLARRGQVAPQLLAVVEGPGQALLQVSDLAAAAGDELVHLTAAIAAHLNFEGVLVSEVRQEITVVIHGFPRSSLSK